MRANRRNETHLHYYIAYRNWTYMHAFDVDIVWNMNIYIGTHIYTRISELHTYILERDDFTRQNSERGWPNDMFTFSDDRQGKTEQERWCLSLCFMSNCQRCFGGLQCFGVYAYDYLLDYIKNSIT